MLGLRIRENKILKSILKPFRRGKDWRDMLRSPKEMFLLRVVLYFTGTVMRQSGTSLPQNSIRKKRQILQNNCLLITSMTHMIVLFH